MRSELLFFTCQTLTHLGVGFFVLYYCIVYSQIQQMWRVDFTYCVSRCLSVTLRSSLKGKLTCPLLIYMITHPCYWSSSKAPWHAFTIFVICYTLKCKLDFKLHKTSHLTKTLVLYFNLNTEIALTYSSASFASFHTQTFERFHPQSQTSNQDTN